MSLAPVSEPEESSELLLGFPQIPMPTSKSFIKVTVILR